MADLIDYKIYKNDDYEILTPDGFKPFVGFIVGKNKNKLRIFLNNNNFFTCTPKHKVMLSKTKYVYAQNLKIGDKIFNNYQVSRIESIENDEPVYEFLEIEGHVYYSNDYLFSQCLLCDEIAFLKNEIVESFWKSIYPIISSSETAQIIVSSTPNGTGNLFHRLYKTAKDGSSEWYLSEIHYTDIPGRDEAWKQDQIKNMGSVDMFRQEFENVFLQDGESTIDEVLQAKLNSTCKEPEFIFDDGCYKVWEEPMAGHIYVAGVDTAEGVGKNASCLNVLDITDLTNIKQVAQYWNNKIIPYNFAKRVNEILENWGKPPALIERNNCGTTVCDQLSRTYNYPNIVTYQHDKEIDVNRPGIISHTNSKYSGITNMRYWVNTLKVVEIRDKATVDELRTFVRKDNGTWSGQSESDLDDRVMSLVWSLFILDKDLVERYFELLKKDDNGKPLMIRPIDWTPMTENKSLSNMYFNEKQTEQDMDYIPMFLNRKNQYSNEMDYLQRQGFVPYQGGSVF